MVYKPPSDSTRRQCSTNIPHHGLVDAVLGSSPPPSCTQYVSASTPYCCPNTSLIAAVDLDFSGLPMSLGRASPLSNRTRAMSRSSLDDDSIISASSSFADVTTPAASSAGESDSDMPIALPPARRRTAAQPAKRCPLAAVAPLTPLRTSTPRESRVAQAPLQPMRASTRSAVSTASIARSTSTNHALHTV